MREKDYEQDIFQKSDSRCPSVCIYCKSDLLKRIERNAKREPNRKCFMLEASEGCIALQEEVEIFEKEQGREIASDDNRENCLSKSALFFVARSHPSSATEIEDHRQQQDQEKFNRPGHIETQRRENQYDCGRQLPASPRSQPKQTNR